MPTMGVGEPAVSRATRRNVPSPPKTMSRSTWRVSAAALGQGGNRNPARRAVAASASTERPVALMRDAALRTSLRLDGLSALATSPMRRIDLASLFKQHEEFLVPRWTEQGRFGDASPAHPGQAG